MPRQYTRRTSEQWFALVESQQQSDLSAPRYCEQHNISYARFCQWRQRFTASQSGAPESPSSSSADFVELSGIASPTSERWQINLSLGDGVELTLSRG